MKNIFDYKDYKRFLISVEQSRKIYERGFRTKLAEALGCQSGYISHVLNGDAHFSLEQAMKISKFINLKTRERKFFLILVEFSRAGTSELQSHFKEELKLLLDQHTNIKERVGETNILSEIEQSTYYSSWHYLAIHVLSSLSEYNDGKAIANALKIPEDVVGKVLLFLTQSNILTSEKGMLKSGITQVHLNRESPLIRQHHTNWRIAAIQSLMNDNRSDVHYSTVSTLSKSDAEKLRLEMLQLIEKYVEVVKPSKEEVMYGFNIDFYNLIK